MADLRREYVPWLKILNHFCDQSVIEEYNAMTKVENKMKYLDCLKSISIKVMEDIILSTDDGK